MTDLTYDDVLELLGYRKPARHPLEILGFAYSAEDVTRFRRERPDYVLTVCAVIDACLRESGGFPRESDRGDAWSYLELHDGEVLLHTQVEIGVGRLIPKAFKFESTIEAAKALIWTVGNPDYLALSSPLSRRTFTVAARTYAPRGAPAAWLHGQ